MGRRVVGLAIYGAPEFAFGRAPVPLVQPRDLSKLKGALSSRKGRGIKKHRFEAAYVTSAKRVIDRGQRQSLSFVTCPGRIGFPCRLVWNASDK